MVAIDVDKDANIDGEYSEQNTNQGHCRESVDHFDSEKHQGTHAYEWKKNSIIITNIKILWPA